MLITPPTGQNYVRGIDFSIRVTNSTTLPRDFFSERFRGRVRCSHKFSNELSRMQSVRKAKI